MRAAQIVGPRRFELVDVEVPSPQDGQCLVKLEQVSVCASDIHRRYALVLPEEEYPAHPGSPCHELAGVVVESRTDSFKEGQRAIVLPPAPSAGLVEYIASDPDRMILLPDEGPLDEWVMCQPSGTALYSCTKMGNLVGKTVLVLGQGSIGLSFTMITSRMGAHSVIAADPLDYRLEKAKEFGATHTVNPSNKDISQAVEEITGGIGPDVVVEAAGEHDTFKLCFRLVRKFGTIILFGIPTEPQMLVDHGMFLRKHATVIPTASGGSGDPTFHIQEIVALRQRGWCDPGKLITHRMGLSDVQTAYDMYEQRTDGIIKVVMNINE